MVNHAASTFKGVPTATPFRRWRVQNSPFPRHMNKGRSFKFLINFSFTRDIRKFARQWIVFPENEYKAIISSRRSIWILSGDPAVASSKSNNTFINEKRGPEGSCIVQRGMRPRFCECLFSSSPLAFSTVVRVLSYGRRRVHFNYEYDPEIKIQFTFVQRAPIADVESWCWMLHDW